MNKTIKILTIGVLSLLLIGSFISLKNGPENNKSFSGVDNFPNFTTSTQITVGKDIATKVATTSPYRMYLSISNISGATSTPAQIISCTTGTNPIAYYGITIFASSSVTFSRETGIPTNEIYCKATVSTSSVTVIDR